MKIAYKMKIIEFQNFLLNFIEYKISYLNWEVTKESEIPGAISPSTWFPFPTLPSNEGRISQDVQRRKKIEQNPASEFPSVCSFILVYFCPSVL